MINTNLDKITVGPLVDPCDWLPIESARGKARLGPTRFLIGPGPTHSRGPFRIVIGYINTMGPSEWILIRGVTPRGPRFSDWSRAQLDCGWAQDAVCCNRRGFKNCDWLEQHGFLSDTI